MGVAHPRAHQYVELLRGEFASKVELAGVFDPNTRKARAFAEQHGLGYFANDRKFLGSGLSSVIVCAETVKRSSLLLQAARAQINILCEPPIASTLAEAKRVLSTVNRTRVTLQMVFLWRSALVCRQLRLWLRQGVIGELMMVNLYCRSPLPKDWRKLKKFSGGGALLDNGVPALDLVRWLTGLEPRSVYLKSATVLSRGQMEDCVIMTLGMGDHKMPVCIDACWTSEDEREGRKSELVLEAVGSRGTARMDLFADRVRIDRSGCSETEMVGLDERRLLCSVLRDFFDSVEHRALPISTAEDGLRSLELALLAYKSARYRKVIPVP